MKVGCTRCVGQLNANGLGGGYGLGVVGDGAKVNAYVLLHGIHHGQPGPAGGQVDLLAHPFQLVAAHNLLGEGGVDAFGNIHHVVEIGVSLI